MEAAAPNGIVTSGFCGKVGSQVLKSTGWQGLFTLTAAHNRSVVGSSPASATKTDTVNDTIVSTAVSLFYRKKHRQNKHL